MNINTSLGTLEAYTTLEDLFLADRENVMRLNKAMARRNIQVQVINKTYNIREAFAFCAEGGYKKIFRLIATDQSKTPDNEIIQYNFDARDIVHLKIEDRLLNES